MQPYKVIFHIDEMSKWKLLLANVNNMIDDMEDRLIIIEVLANSEAVKFFIQKDMNENDYTLVQRFINKNVLFSLCNNSLKSNKIEIDTLLSGLTIVSSGVSELMLKQHEGYAYIKP